jgi:hypothetical protein
MLRRDDILKKEKIQARQGLAEKAESLLEVAHGLSMGPICQKNADKEATRFL